MSAAAAIGAAVVVMPASGLLIVWHSRTGAARQLARAAADGARGAGEGGVVRVLSANRARADDLLAAAGYLFICPENLGTMSGAMKEMFDRCYYPLLGALNGRPYAAIIAAGSDGHGAAAQLARIATGWRLRPVAESLIVTLGAQRAEEIAAPKMVPGAGLAAAGELGGRLAAGIAWGIY